MLHELNYLVEQLSGKNKIQIKLKFRIKYET